MLDIFHFLLLELALGVNHQYRYKRSDRRWQSVNEVVHLVRVEAWYRESNSLVLDRVLVIDRIYFSMTDRVLERKQLWSQGDVDTKQDDTFHEETFLFSLPPLHFRASLHATPSVIPTFKLQVWLWFSSYYIKPFDELFVGFLCINRFVLVWSKSL